MFNSPLISSLVHALLRRRRPAELLIWLGAIVVLVVIVALLAA